MRLALALLVLGLMSLPAQAALTLCNRTSYILYAATSAIQSPRSETEGWTRIAPGECQVARKEALTAETYLVHARTITGPFRPAARLGRRLSGLRQGRQFHHQAGGDRALLHRRRHLRAALRRPGQSRQGELDHEFRRAAGNEPERGAARRGQAPAQGQWLCDRAHRWKAGQGHRQRPGRLQEAHAFRRRCRQRRTFRRAGA